MTAGRRIFLNIVATYGRSLYSLACGLFVTRWVLAALGHVDYGLYGVVGGLVVFIGFFNSVLATSVGRFYAYSVGVGKKDGCYEKGLAECRKWFTIALSVHLVLPLFLVMVGYPIGAYAIENWLVIPKERISDCLIVFRCVCATCFISMVSVPFNAMYTAKQYIAELTVYSFVTTTVNVVALYYMVTHPREWLVGYAVLTSAVQVVPLLCIVIVAAKRFPECRLVKKFFFSWRDIRTLFSFAGWNVFGALGDMMKNSGMAILVNLYFGPRQNSAMAVANSVSGQTQALSGAMVGAFMPAITNACGAGDKVTMMRYVYLTCKFGTLLLLPFCIPLSIEMKYVINLWLQSPPPCVEWLCVLVLISLAFEKLTVGLWVAISAHGDIAKYQFVIGCLFVATLPIAWVMMFCGVNVYAVGYSLCLTRFGAIGVRLYFMRKLLGVGPSFWFFHIFTPISFVCLLSVLAGLVPYFTMGCSLLRVGIVTFVSGAVLLVGSWLVVLDASEKEFASSRFKMLAAKVTG